VKAASDQGMRQPEEQSQNQAGYQIRTKYPHRGTTGREWAPEDGLEHRDGP
jgi:hypothetical protein